MAANAVCLLSVISCRVSGDTESEGASIVTASCASGIAAGDGRDLFSLQSGRLLNIAGRLCVGVVGDVVGGGRWCSKIAMLRRNGLAWAMAN